MSHPCAVPGCGVGIPQEFLMCGRHWLSLPKGLREAVWRTYRAGASEEYLAAQEKAIAFFVSKGSGLKGGQQTVSPKQREWLLPGSDSVRGGGKGRRIWD